MIVVDRSKGGSAMTTRARAWPLLRRIRFLPLIPLLLMTGGVVGLYFQPPGVRWLMNKLGLQPGGGAKNPIAVPAPKAEPVATAPTTRTVVALGKLVPTGEVRVVAPPFGAGDARIAKLEVDEGQRLESGALLAILDNEAQFKAAVDAANATVAAREAALNQTRATVRASLDEAAATLGRAEASAKNAQAEFERIDTLFKKGISTEATLSQKRAARDETAREIDRAKANLSRYQSITVDEQPDVVVALRNLASAKSELARATQDLDKAYVRAPISGTVLSVRARPGEKPGTNGILSLANLDQMEAEIEVFQTQIGFVAAGDTIDITAESLPRPLKGKVTRVGLEVGRQTLVDPNPAANTDARVVKVHAVLDADSSGIAKRFTSLQIIARITTQARP
jgi:HlyD family secretion protein